MQYQNFIKNKFEGQEVFIVASGPSLIGFNYSKLENKNVICVNHSYKLVKNHSFVVFVDKSFPEKESPDVVNTTCLTQYNAELKDKENIIFFKFINHFDNDPSKGVYHRSSSGAVAVSVALHSGASKIYLLGFDCRGVGLDEAKKICFDNGGDHRQLDRKFYGHSTSGVYTHNRDDAKNMHIFQSTINKFALFPKEKIINLSQISAIPYFTSIHNKDVLG